MALDLLDAPAARRWAGMLLAVLAGAREEIDALNVYPVPDGDTGTNLYMTVEAGVAAAALLPEDAGLVEATDAFARGALLGARGNSGAIFAALVRAWAQVVGESGRLDAAAARRALVLADAQAWTAVARPVHGTMLSLSRAAADAVEPLPDDASLADVLATAAEAARQALARTPQQLDVLRRAGVVDAGGKGLLLALHVLAEVVAGRDEAPGSRRGRRVRRPENLPPVDLTWCDDAAAGGPAYEVMYLLEADDDAVAGLRAHLSELGESLVVVGGAGLWHVHVHVDRPGAAVEAGVEVGRPSQIRITSLLAHPHEEQPPGLLAAHEARDAEFRLGTLGTAGSSGAIAALGASGVSPVEATGEAGIAFLADGPVAPSRRGTSALLACATGPGLATLFVGVGARVLEVATGRAVTTAQLLDAIRATRAESVAVLPNDTEALAAAQAAAAVAREEGLRVSVVPTRAQVQGIAAAAVHDPVRRFDDDVVLMSAAAGACRDGAVRPGTGDVVTAAGPAARGDWLGVVGGEPYARADPGDGGALAVAVAVLDRLLAGGGELVTLVSGAGVDPALLDRVEAYLADRHPAVEVSVHDGGQEDVPLLIGVE